MRLFGMGMLVALSLLVGCEKPIEGIPGPEGSGVTGTEAPKVEMPSEEKKEGDKEAPAADAPAADAPKADAPKTDGDKPAATEPPPVEQPAAPADAPKGAAASSTAAGKFVSTKLKVPTMSCPHGCWPTVKETLSTQPGVESVELAKQSNADAIDNPIVMVKYKGKFDSSAAIAALAKAGFDNAEVAN